VAASQYISVGITHCVRRPAVEVPRRRTDIGYEIYEDRSITLSHEQVMIRWEADRVAMSAVNGRPPYPYTDDEQRRVARDAYVSWKGSRYSVPWLYAGKEVWVRDHGPSVEIRYSAERIASHAPRDEAPPGRHAQPSPHRHPSSEPAEHENPDSHRAECAGGGASASGRI
jgi:hypothetical protein